MEIKLFGKHVFSYRGRQGNTLFEQSSESLKKSEFLPDFNTMRAHDNFSEFLELTQSNTPEDPSAPRRKGAESKAVKPEDEKINVKITPKGVYELKLLNDDAFTMNTDKEYIEGQLQDFRDKLDILKLAEFDMSRGQNEIASIIVRMENRLQYPKHQSFYEEFAYTTSSKISDMLKGKGHDHLRLGKVEQFIADMPKEAVAVMKAYNKETKELCGKKAVFYIIADKKDFEKTEQRRDPILLAQSPFGHFWQILGAWDEEMLLLEEL